MWVRLRANTGPKPEELVEAFIATEPPTTQAFGATAYQFDTRTTSARLPVRGHATYTVIAGRAADGAPMYLLCQASEAGTSITPAPRCELFTTDVASGLRVHAQFFQDRAPQWRRIQAQLSELLGSWASPW